VSDERFDLVVIGSGPGGYVAAIRAAQRGARVALVEKERLGGACLNRGCIPTKAMIHDAHLYRAVASGAYCVASASGFRVDFRRLMARKRSVVETLVEGVARLLDTNGVTLLQGEGRIERPDRVIVRSNEGERPLTARSIVVATGSVPSRVPIPGNDLPAVVTSRELLEIDALPESLVVIGGSVVGVEFACMFAALGTKVSLVGRQTFVKEAEPQLAKRLRGVLGRMGMAITIGVAFQRIDSKDGKLRVTYERRGQQESAEGDLVLLATGRQPYSEGLGLERLGVRMNGPAIAVDEHLQTSVPGVYAIGDCIGGYMLAHVASYEAEVAVDNILGSPRAADYRVVPNCIYTIPEVAGVGLTEAEAKERGLDVKVTRFPFGVNGRAVAMGEEEGQVRILCAADSTGRGGAVLGVHIMGPHASELIAEAALAMRMNASAEDIAETIHAHPTASEALMEAAMAQVQGAIHYDNR